MLSAQETLSERYSHISQWSKFNYFICLNSMKFSFTDNKNVILIFLTIARIKTLIASHPNQWHRTVKESNDISV